MRIGVHWLFVALLVVAMFFGYHQQALILLGSLAAHELAHLVVAWVLGFTVEDVMLTPFGGMARLESTLETDPQAETSIALAGPFMSFILAGLALFLLGEDLWNQELVRFFYLVNVNLAFFNLIPALPLDGGRAFRGLLAQRWGYRRVSSWMVFLGRACGMAMTLIALWVLLRYQQFFLTPLVGGLFLCLGAGQDAELATFRSYRQFLRKRERLGKARIIQSKQLVTVQGTQLKDLLPHLAERRYHLVLVVNEDLQPLGTLHEAELIEAFHEQGPEARVEEILDL